MDIQFFLINAIELLKYTDKETNSAIQRSKKSIVCNRTETTYSNNVVTDFIYYPTLDYVRNKVQYTHPSAYLH